MEACATSHYWGRLALRLEHDVRLVPPIYVKPFVKRQKNDAADAAAIAEAALRPNMHYVSVMSVEHQVRAVAFRTHQCSVRQRTQLINALRGYLAEFGLVVPKGPVHIKRFNDLLAEGTAEVPDTVREIALRTVPGVGPVTAGAVMALAPDLRTFSSGRNFAAWLGLVPKQSSTGGKTRLGGISRMGQTDIRKLQIVGAMSRIRWTVRKGITSDNWLGRLVGRKLRMVAAVALANKMARIIWAIMTREQNYRMA